MKYSSGKKASILRIKIYVFFFILICRNIIAQPTTEWVRTYPDSNTFRAGAYALALDDSGNVYITGFTEYNNPVMMGYCTIKYSSSGVQQWVANYYSIYVGGRYARAIIVDKSHNIYITGYSYEYGNHFDYCTVKYNPNGVEQWVRYYNGQVNEQDEAQKIVVDNAGNIYVSGFSRVIGGFSNVTIKYSPEGQVLWTKSYNNITSVRDMIVDVNCNIYITGVPRARTIKYDSSGNLLWAQFYESGNAASNSIVLDKNNNVYITGYYIVSTGWYNYLTIKYSPSGTQEWARRYSIDSTSFNQSVANAITIDNSGNVYVSGYTEVDNTPKKLTTVKYSNSGNSIWVKIDSDTLISQSTFMDIDKKNNIYITGSIYKSPQSQTYGIIKYDSSGKEEWRKNEYYGSYPSSIKVDDDFNIYLTGSSYIGQKMCTVKFSQIVGLSNNHNTIPFEFKLYQNYPNPFNLSTTIKFDISSNVKQQTADVKFIILDILGREVVSLMNEQLQPGRYEFEWNAINYSSGIYFYRFLTDSYIETRKMILLK